MHTASGYDIIYIVIYMYNIYHNQYTADINSRFSSVTFGISRKSLKKCFLSTCWFKVFGHTIVCYPYTYDSLFLNFFRVKSHLST